ncbi:MAG: NAD-dependent epimerase/dehydratase family protein [Halieaceae bacterium]
MKCLVTGASGFIGAELCHQLEQRGAELRSCGREAPDDQQLRGCQIIYHCAGIAHRSATAAEYQDANHGAVLALARRAARAGVQRFVFLSSVNAGPEANSYGYWKWRAEQDLAEEFADSPMGVVLVRPALVYGVGAKANLRSLIELVRRGLPTPPAGAARSMIGLPDLCAALCLMIDIDPGRGQVFCLTDGQSYDLQRMHGAICEAQGRPQGRSWLPAWCWQLACRSIDLAQGRPASDGLYRRLFGGGLYSNEAICRALQWQPRDSLEDLMPAMLEGYD